MCGHYTIKLQESDRHYIDSPEDNNCVLCLSERKGPMTQSEIASYLGLCKMRICQIERRAMHKLSKRIKPIYR
jgi:transcriptional regulator